MANGLRYQILYDAEPPGRGSKHINCKTKQEAQKIMRRLRQEGKKHVSLWDTQNNPLSDLLRF